MNAFFDEAKGVYRVTNSNGSFDTYTPTQYREKFGVSVEVEEEEEQEEEQETATTVTVTEEVLNENPELAEAGLKVGDVGTVQNDFVDFSTSEVEAGTEVVATEETTSSEVEITNNETSTQI